LRTLHKYIVRQVLASMVMTVAVFTFVLLIGNVLKEILKLLISHQIGFGVAMEAIGLLIPFVWVFALPMGLLTATLLVFGRFSADQELTAARASGISLVSLVMPVLLLSLFCCGLSAWINMELGPQCRATYNSLILNARSGFLNAQLPEGQFIRDFPGYVLYVEKNDGGNLKNVTVFWSERDTIIRSPRGKIDADVAHKQLTMDLFDARSVSIMTNGSAPVFMSFRDYLMTFDMNSATNRISKPRISDMTFWQLRDEMNDMERRLALPPAAATNSVELRAQLEEARKQRGDLTEPIRVEMNREVAFSFACFGFALIGIPLGIRVHRRETNIGVAIALGLTAVYFSFMLVGKSLSGHPEWSPHLIFWLPNFIFQAVGAVLLWRANRGI
jgi:lipopolysaccharide export system permease protein